MTAYMNGSMVLVRFAADGGYKAAQALIQLGYQYDRLDYFKDQKGKYVRCFRVPAEDAKDVVELLEDEYGVEVRTCYA